MNKSMEYYLSLPYPIELIPDENGYWFARIPLPGCMTQGATRIEALEMLDDAIGGCSWEVEQVTRPVSA